MVRNRTTIHYDGNRAPMFFIGSMISLFLATAAAWITHIVWVIGKITGGGPVTGGDMALGVLGAFMPPIGVIHGFVIWFS